MQPKYLLSFSVLGWFCLCFITPVHANLPTTPAVQQMQRQTLMVSSDLEPTSEETLTDAYTRSFVRLYTNDWSHYTEELLGKAIYFFPLFSYHLKEASLPDALKYLPLVESHLNTDIVSSRGAVGLWQFMPGTATHYGLEVNAQEDERYDPQRATEAAAKMLQELYQDFDDWKLVLAAYNCGPGRVRRAIRKASSTEYQRIQRYLPRQTRDYIKKFMAIVYIGTHYDDYGLSPKMEIDDLKNKWTATPMNGRLDLKNIADLANVDLDYLQQLNENWTSTDGFQDLILPAYAKKELDKHCEEINGTSIDFLAEAGKLPLISTLLLCQDNLEPNGSCFPNNQPKDGSSESDTENELATWAVIPRKEIVVPLLLG